MGMAEDIQMMQMLQQQANMQQGGNSNGQQAPSGEAFQQSQLQIPQQRTNPLQSGSHAAIESAKRSLEMDENENRRALGRAMIGMMSAISQNPQYGRGIGGNLSAINAGFAPALNAYDAERDRISQMNHALRVQQKQEEMLARKEEREMKKIAHDLEMEDRKIKVAEGYLGLERMKNEEEKKEREEISQPGAKIPLSHLTPSQWNLAQKEIQSNIEKGDVAHYTLESINAAKKILKEDPNITKNMSTIMLAAQRHDPSIVRQKLNSWFIPEKTRVNSEMLAKYLSNIYTSKLKGMPARGMNMFLEKQLREGNVDINMTSPAIIELLEHDEKVLEHTYKNSQEVYDEYEKGYFYRPRPIKHETHETEENMEANEGSNKNISSSTSTMGLNEEQKQSRINELLKMRETAKD